MPHRIFRLLLIAVLVAVCYSPKVGYAAEASPYETYCQGTWYEGDPHPLAILCPVVRLLNVFIFSVGAIFVVFVLLSSLKFAMAQGDPKALQGAKQSLTVAIAGMLVVIGVFTIMTILSSIFGLKAGILTNPFEALFNGLVDLFEKLNIN